MDHVLNSSSVHGTLIRELSIASEIGIVTEILLGSVRYRVDQYQTVRLIRPKIYERWSLFLFLLCNNIHQNHIDFIEFTKSQIRSTTLEQQKMDVEAFILDVSNLLCLITSAGKETKLTLIL